MQFYKKLKESFNGNINIIQGKFYTENSIRDKEVYFIILYVNLSRGYKNPNPLCKK